MKIKSMYIAYLEPNSDSLTVCMGLMEALKSKIDNIAFFRPIVLSKNVMKDDKSISFMLEYFDIKIKPQSSYGFTVKEIESAIANNSLHEIIQHLISVYKDLENKYDFIICEGFPKELLSSTLDFDLNLEFAKNLNIPLLNIINAKDKSYIEILDEIKIETNAIKKTGCKHLSTFVNRLSEDDYDMLNKNISNIKNNNVTLNLLPEVKELHSPTIEEIIETLECKVIFGKESDLKRVVKNTKAVAMTIDNMLSYLKDGDLIITSGDRSDIILASLVANSSTTYPTLAGVLLSGNISPNKHFLNLISGFTKTSLPILSIDGDTLETINKVKNVPARIRTRNKRKIALAMGLFSNHVDVSKILKYIDIEHTSSSMTPIMFEYNLFEMARKSKKCIVLPESGDDRILRAAEMLLRRNVVDIILLGNKNKIDSKASTLGIDISMATIVDPTSSEFLDDYIKTFYELRKHKGITLEKARDIMQNVNYFATMMVYMGHADGMVSGAIHTTSDTIRPALQIIKTKQDISIISSVFFMCLDTRVLVYGDCAINQDPTSDELSQIAISSAKTASDFGITPKIAMLSYSTGNSAKGEVVDKVRVATSIVKLKEPNLLVEGPIQYDAAIDPTVAKTKLPESKVAGKATVFIFPDLNTGNNTYKAVQRSSNAVAIGPILQGLNKPVNDLSRGCLVEDIVNTVAITAIQASQN